MKKTWSWIVLIVLLLIFLPKVNWGKISLLPVETVTVNGEAKSQQKNEIATFTAGVEVVSSVKEGAVTEVNGKIAELTKAIKDFGITEADIKTQNISIYQEEDSYWDGGVQKSRKGLWRVNNSIEIVLRDVTRVNDFADLLNKSAANNVYGPNFAMSDINEVEKSLYEGAMEDAKEKAATIARYSGRRIGKVISVNETSGGQVMPVYMKSVMLDSGGAGVEPGSSTVYKGLTVVFELK